MTAYERANEAGPPNPIAGLHHITAIAGSPQENVDFYAGALGLRLVKRTVNFDDPGTYHFYYGNEEGQPGTILTFFPWAEAAPGRPGSGQASSFSFSVPPDSLGYWRERLRSHAIEASLPIERFDEELIEFRDHDGLRMELVASPGRNGIEPWSDGPVDPRHAIRGFHGATLSEQGCESTASLLTETMGFRFVGQDGNRFRFETAPGQPGSRLDLLCGPDAARGRMGKGTVHHVAWRVADEDQEETWRRRLTDKGLNVTPILDRNYFRSIYFREPGGVLFEFATDPPGFTVDEPAADLGAELKLPAWLEPARREIQASLPPIRRPGAQP